ncbi:MAG TPA: type II toxin-antitoxin system death-on-curing family toxin [Dehalococcoidia bacterium]|nr:type II toxin-antitoxin system death-on-curing family toxin [Dehalococcoidia bacterium]
MSEVVYLTTEQVFTLYSAIFECTQQQAAHQLRSRAGLESALARAQFYGHYEDADLAMQAAVLAQGIAETQPFIEGNKRTALACLALFLDLNGYRVTASQQERMEWMLSLAEGATAAALAERIRACLAPAR